jgi:hypothetical protein
LLINCAYFRDFDSSFVIMDPLWSHRQYHIFRTGCAELEF